MSVFFSILNICAPLLLITTGALVSEYAGRMALFLDGLINLGAFLCYAFTVLTGNCIIASFLSVIVCTLITIGAERLVHLLKANTFLAALAMNILFTALTSFLSYIFFHTRGVLYSDAFSFNVATMRTATTIICFLLSALFILALHFTHPGLVLRTTGQSKDVLKTLGVNVSMYEGISWAVAAVCAATAGCTLSLRLSSYVPSIAAGRGWTALAIVFLGRKKSIVVALCVVLFAAAEYCSTNIQNIPLFASTPSSLLLSLPYLLSLLLIIIMPRDKESI